MARIIKYYAENGVTVIEEDSTITVLRPSFTYNEISDIVSIINLDNQAQDWSAESSVFRKKDGSSIGSTKSEIVTYLSENTIFSKSEEIPDTSWGTIIGTLSDQTDLQSSLDAKQDELVSGTNIKTINGSSVLGSGDINITSANPTSGVIPVNDNGTLVDSVIAESNGNVGIGTTSPNFDFTIQTSLMSPQKISNIGLGGFLGLGFTSYEIGHGYGGYGSNITSKISFEADASTPPGFFADVITFNVTPTSTSPSIGDSTNEAMRITSDGNVGIGTTAPSETLDVNGTIKGNRYKSADGSEGVTQTVNVGGGSTITIKNGLITAVN